MKNLPYSPPKCLQKPQVYAGKSNLFNTVVFWYLSFPLLNIHYNKNINYIKWAKWRKK